MNLRAKHQTLIYITVYPTISFVITVETTFDVKSQLFHTTAAPRVGVTAPHQRDQNGSKDSVEQLDVSTEYSHCGLSDRLVRLKAPV